MLDKCKHWKDKVRIIGVSADFDSKKGQGNPPKVISHCNNKGWTSVEHYVAKDRSVLYNFGVQGFPTIMLIDKEGECVFKNHPLYIRDLELAIEKLIKGEKFA